MLIFEAYEKYKIMPGLQEHQLRVAAVAETILENFTQPLSGRDEIVKACLLHDMGNIIKFNLGKLPELLEPQGLKYWQGVQAEFVLRYGKDEQTAGIPVRQPLATFFVTDDISLEYKKLLCDELNVKNIEKGTGIAFDETITDELKKEGDYREFLREVQDLRKAEGLSPSDSIVLAVPEQYKTVVADMIDDFKVVVGVKEIVFSSEIKKIEIKK